MTARALSLGGAVAVGLEGPRVTPSEERAILAHGVRAFILFERNLVSPAAAIRLVDALSDLAWRASGGPPLILIDEEGGLVSEARRLGTPAPAAMALGAFAEPALAREWAWRTGRRLAILGAGLVLAPVLDVNTERRNPVIGFRAYGDSPDLVTRLGLAAIEGYASAGVLCAPKHFPGHGGVSIDSHERLPRSLATTSDEAEPHLAPFRAAIDAGAPAILAAHLAAPALAGGSEAPATLSPEILTELLRGELGFRGAVVTDDLAMGALAESGGPEGVAVRALAAGADLLLYAEGFAGGAGGAIADDGEGGAAHPAAEAALAAIDRAIAAGALPESRVAEAIERIDTLARASDDALGGAGCGPRCGAGPAEREAALDAFDQDDGAARARLTPVQEFALGGASAGAPVAIGDAAEAAPLAIPIPEGTTVLLPARLEGRRRRDVPWPPAAGRALAALRARVVRFPFNPSESEVAEIVARIGDDRPVVLGLLARGPLSRGQSRLAARLLARPGLTIPVALLNPFVLDEIARAASAQRAHRTPLARGLATFGFEPEDIAALARVLSGRSRPLAAGKTG